MKDAADTRDLTDAEIEQRIAVLTAHAQQDERMAAEHAAAAKGNRELAESYRRDLEVRRTARGGSR